MLAVEKARAAGHNLLLLTIVTACWLPLVACYYLMYPLTGRLSLFGLLMMDWCWLWAVGGSVTALGALVRRRAYGWAAGTLVLALVSGYGVRATDWERVFVDSQFRMQRGQLAELAADYRAGTLPAGDYLPWRLRHLSIDGAADQHDSYLYLPVWQDWRAERGVGLAYFPTPPDPETTIRTALGDLGQPVRYLGDGWWWVA